LVQYDDLIFQYNAATRRDSTMRQVLTRLPPGARVLDLGCAHGSFPAALTKALIVRVDKHPLTRNDAFTISADAACLPFQCHVFDAIICNHSLEHFEDLTHSLEEIGRVLKASGFLYISVPDGGTFSDRVYRWLAAGGGHINQFRSAEQLAQLISECTSVPHKATRTLCSSFSFMNRRNPHPRQPKKMALFFWGSELFLVFFNAVLRLMDRLFMSRASVYGWALYFGNISEPIMRQARVNVCVRCGQGHPSNWLKSVGAVEWHLVPLYRCPTCHAINFFVRDESYTHL
jgi:ubiquinone/menaquinone biosynthesis C-methylase UbiE